jgi:hypothetical protein
MNVLLFPGQGAQKVGMAADLSAAFPAARATLDAIDTALAFPSKLMAEGPEADLQLTHNTQPAILAHFGSGVAVVRHKLGRWLCRGPQPGRIQCVGRGWGVRCTHGSQAGAPPG